MLKLIILLIIIAGCIYFFSDNKYITNTLGINSNKSHPKSSNRPPQTNSHFKSLLGYGKLIAGLGWILFIIGILMIISVFE